MDRQRLCGLTVEEIFSIIEPEGFSYAMAGTIATWLYRKRTFDISEFTGLSKKLKNYIGENTEPGIFEPAISEKSSDGTIKYVFQNPEGQKFETVYIPDGKRITVCVSTQSGCRMGCPFCVTGSYGFHGNLTAGDIINQIIRIPDSEKVNHIVFMGMGEPMDNLENVLKACRIITSEWGLAISSRNITVSSVGITPGIEEFLERTSCNLTLSLYSPFPEERVKIVPSESKFPMLEIIEILKRVPVKKKRRLSIAYVMMKDVNDTLRHLEELIRILKNSGIKVNLLSFHPVEGDNTITSIPERMMYFKHNLIVAGIPASVRKSRGKDISAACGLLATGLISEK